MIGSRPRGDRAPNEERGSVTVLSAGAMVLAAVLVLSSVDVMRAVQGGAKAQTAADAAALAAAQEIALPSGSTPSEMASRFAELNGAALVTCTCEPGSSEAVVEVAFTVDLLFVGLDREVHAHARAVIEGTGPPWPEDERRSSTRPPVRQIRVGRYNGRRHGEAKSRGRSARPVAVDGGGRLHAGQARLAAPVPPGTVVAVGDLRRPSRTVASCPVSGGGSPPALPRVPAPGAAPPCLCVRRRASFQQRTGLRRRRRDGPRCRPSGRDVLRGRGVHRMLVEPSDRGVHGSHRRLRVLRAATSATQGHNLASDTASPPGYIRPQ